MRPVLKALNAVMSFILLVACVITSGVGAVMIVVGVGIQKLAGQDRSLTHSATREWQTFGPDGAARQHFIEVSMENGPTGCKHLVDGTLSKLFEQAEHEINEELRVEREEANNTTEEVEDEEPAAAA